MRRALVVLGGSAPSPTFFHKMAQTCDFLLCADSGLDAAIDAGIRPDAVIGDFDSAKPASVAYMERENIPHIVYPAIKDDTDGMACARYLLERRPEEVVFLGAGGGRIDHWLANFQLLIYLEKNGIPARAEQEDCTAWAVHDRLTVHGTPGELLSVLQMTEELQLSLSGLFYPLDHRDVEFGHPLGVSNVLTEPEAHVLVHKGWALVLHFHGAA
ncbi:MAG: thiamine diphosphokinase [Candidatus Spyradocola sp.]|jgi:thiamine pyrophosphokinase